MPVPRPTTAIKARSTATHTGLRGLRRQFGQYVIGIMGRDGPRPPTELLVKDVLPQPISGQIDEHAHIMYPRIACAVWGEERAYGTIGVKMRVKRVSTSRDLGTENPDPRDPNEGIPVDHCEPEYL